MTSLPNNFFLPVPKRSSSAGGFLILYWILVKIVDLSNLSHPNEFAAITSLFSAIHKVLVSTQGAEETDSIPRVTIEIKSAPQPPCCYLGRRGDTRGIIEYCFHLRAFP